MKGFCISALLWVMSLMYVGCGSNAQKSDADLATHPPLIFDVTQSDSVALRLADDVQRAAGGKEQLAAVRYLSFHFVLKADSGVVSDWRHDWDRVQQRYRLAGKLASGEQVLVFLNLNTQEGHAFLNGNPAPEDEAQALLAMAYSRFTSDTYWLLLPFKLKDPGARLQFLGTRQIASATYEVIHLSFIDDVGLTPENEFDIYLDPATHEIRRWEYFENPEAEPRIASWEDWQTLGGLRLPLQRRLEESGRTIYFEEVVASPQVDEAVFAVPAATHAGMP